MFLRDIIARIRGSRPYSLAALRILRMVGLIGTGPIAWIAARFRTLWRLSLIALITVGFTAWVVAPVARLTGPAHHLTMVVQDVTLGCIGFIALCASLRWVFRARRRIVIEAFTEYRALPHEETSTSDAGVARENKRGTTGIATLVAVELANLRAVYLDADDHRSARGERAVAISQTTATIQASDVDDLFTATSAGDARLTLGPLTVPLGILLGLLSRLVRGPRIIGSVHLGNDRLVVTGQIVGAARPSAWRVECASAGGGEGMESLVKELACRIFTDVMLGSPCNYAAATEFTEGLRAYRECLRTPTERTSGLRQAERAFRKATAADESFERAYHNLGIVYADMGRLDSADQAFSAAIVRDSNAWPSYYALAHTRVQQAMLAQDGGDHGGAVRYFRESAALATKAAFLEPPHPSAAMAHNLAGLAERELAGLTAEATHQAETHIRNFVSHAMWAARFAAFDFVFVRVRNPSIAAPAENLVGLCFRNLGIAWDRYANHLSKTSPRPRLRIRLFRWRARGCLAIGVRRRPNDAQARYALGKAWHYTWRDDTARQRLHRRAVRAYRQAVAIDPIAPQYASRLAEAVSEFPNAEYIDVVAAAAIVIESPSAARASDIDRVRRALSNVGKDAEATSMEQIERVRRELPHWDRLSMSELRERLRECRVPWVRGMLQVALSRKLETAGRLRQADRRCKLAIETLQDRHAHEIAFLGLHAERAALRSRLGDIKDALRECEVAIDLAPLNPSVRETQGDIFESQGDWEHARIAWEEALLCIAQSDSHWRRGRYFQDSASARDLRIEPEPQHAQIHFKLGRCYLKVAEEMQNGAQRAAALAQARESLDRALSLYDHSDDRDSQAQAHEQRLLVHFWLGRADTASCNYEAAFPHLEIARALENGRPASTLYLGEAHLLGRRYQSAERWLRDAIAEAGDKPSSERRGRTIGEPIVGLSMSPTEARAKASLLLALSLLERDAHSDEPEKLLSEARSALAESGMDTSHGAASSSEDRAWRARLAYAGGLLHSMKEDTTLAAIAFRESLAHEANPEAYLALARLRERDVTRSTARIDVRRAVDEGRFHIEQARLLDRTGHHATTADRLHEQLASHLERRSRRRD